MSDLVRPAADGARETTWSGWEWSGGILGQKSDLRRGSFDEKWTMTRPTIRVANPIKADASIPFIGPLLV
jgi:hypothetical protein